MTFAFGDYATVTESMTDSQIINEIMLHLKSIYGNSIPNPSNFLRTKWGQNINSYGAYSYATNNSTSADFDTLADVVDNKVFFAGEHTERDYRGTVHGAYLSGIREADKIINLP
jgi:monoamine oxidase